MTIGFDNHYPALLLVGNGKLLRTTLNQQRITIPE